MILAAVVGIGCSRMFKYRLSFFPENDFALYRSIRMKLRRLKFRAGYVSWLAGVYLQACCLVLAFTVPASSHAQVPPSLAERAAYTGLHAAAWSGDAEQIGKLLAQAADRTRLLESRDARERTALHVAAFASKPAAMKALVAAGANPNALEADRYDVLTIAAVANDLEVLKTALALGCKPDNITSRYDGTALIAAAHLGHHESVELLIKAGAPVNHVNNLGWNALIESVALGDGGLRHQKTMSLLLDGGADVQRTDRQGARPLALARALGYSAMVRMLEAAERK